MFAASKVLRSRTSSRAEKAVAASALTKSKSATEAAGKSIVANAAKILKDPKASREAKTVAASVLVQKPRFKAGTMSATDIYRAVEGYYSKK